MRVFILANGGAYIGMGHIMRTLVLAKELQRKYTVKYIFSLDKEFKKGQVKVLEEGLDFIYENDIFKIINSGDILIIDRYDISMEFIRNIKDSGIFILMFDDNGDFEFYNCDMILNQNIHGPLIKYNCLKETKVLAGGEFSVLRDEFLENTPTTVNESLRTILITVGGSDNFNITSEILNKIKVFDFKFNVVIGPAFKFEKELMDEFENIKNIKFIKNADMPKLMKNCDVCISACGSTIYELCYLGVPTIGLVIAENQKFVGEYLNKNNIAIISNIKELDEKLKLMTYEKRIDLNIKMKKIIDGNGKYRVIEELFKKYKEKNIL